MNIARDTLTEAIKRALGLTFSVTTVMGGTVAMAQDDVDDGEEIEEILITGSKIQRANLDNANPVTVVSRDDMLVTGIRMWAT
ncbi:MAG: hypothetical protein CM15mP74_12300 [Halieaceae bacterium]|nr:MAG: hypothetical protein CM15mP74_12300 [Halieaceae bacterium]